MKFAPTAHGGKSARKKQRGLPGFERSLEAPYWYWKSALTTTALATAERSTAILSPFETAVLVKSVSVADDTDVPVESETPLVLIEFPLVGVLVPVATFQNFTVAVQLAQVPEPVPSSTLISQPIIVPAFAATMQQKTWVVSGAAARERGPRQVNRLRGYRGLHKGSGRKLRRACPR